MRPHIAADVLHIGYPKAASTFIARFLTAHPEVTFDQHRLRELLVAQPHPPTLTVKPSLEKKHVSRDENVAESLCIVGQPTKWRRYRYIPGAWDQIKDDIIVDPAETASRMYRAHPEAKVLLVIREQADWMNSVYKYSMAQLPSTGRSFADYCVTPYGAVVLQAGHFDQTISAYIDIFGSKRVGVLRYEDIIDAPKRFAAQLCAFIGVSERPLPQERENESHAQIANLQRLFPVISRLPRKIKDAIKPHAARLLP